MVEMPRLDLARLDRTVRSVHRSTSEVGMPIYVPASGPASWQMLLADPQKQWVTGYSARTLACCWQSAKGLPPEIAALFGSGSTLLIGIPEHKVDLPGGSRPSQSDLFALIRRGTQTVSCTIEGKVSESFDRTVKDWMEDASPGKAIRLEFLCRTLGLAQPLPPTVRYQLLHRAVSAVIEADRFKTDEAAMIVHSFSPTGAWFDDYAAFVSLLGGKPERDRLTTINLPSGKLMHFGWATGDAQFLAH